ncbi:MAG: hypothetical protein QF442_01830 [Candidatus Peribacteraceae bacterium]|jgi:hypothetical protein|nr:hypothetical protein [Candidatus Peribacteraceae bacterium]
MTKNKGGRPTAITPAVVQKLLEAFRLDLPIEEACKYACIAKQTYYNHCKNDEFLDEMEHAKMEATLKARRTVIEKMEDDGSLSLKYLERKRKEEFSPRVEQQIEGNTIAVLIKEQEEMESVDWDRAESHLASLRESAANRN